MRCVRVLVATFGSAGDLFPLIPVIHELTEQGCDVRAASGRGVGLYLRSLGVSAIGLGDGAELRVVNDPRAFTTRFDGWSSWRRTVTFYVGPTLERDVGTLSAVIEHWRPHVIVASGFASAARIVAVRAGVPLVDLSIYPQHALLASSGTGLAQSYVRHVSRLAGEGPNGAVSATKLAWGVPAEVLLHDRALLGATAPGLDPVGYPYWDAVPGRGRDEQMADVWLSAEGPTVLVTLGSFIGVAQRNAWRDAAAALATLGVRGLFVGASERWSEEAFGARKDVLCVGFIPLSRFVGRADAVVHHGGLGTSFAALWAGRPAVVLPQSFDQSFNARLIESAGAGVNGSVMRLVDALTVVLDARAQDRVAELAERLIDPEEATRAAVDAILAAAGGLSGAGP